VSAHVSVVVPAYNSVATIGEALDSVLAQTVPPHEIVVVDDGSTDGTAAVVARYAPGVRLVRQRNAGVGGARNRGVRETTGHWLVFLDADDILEREAIERQLAVAKRHPACALVGGSGVQFDSGGTVSTSIIGPDLAARLASGVPSMRIAYTEIVARNPFTTPGQTMIARAAIERIGGFSERRWFSEDWDMWLRLANEHALFVHAAPVLRYRISSTSLSGPPNERMIRWALRRVPVIREHLTRATDERRELLLERLDEEVHSATMAAYYLGRHVDRRLGLGYLARLAWVAPTHTATLGRLLALALPDAFAGWLARSLRSVRDFARARRA
jgi:glycosyltransferase involved in cell wall biosynthesis